MKVVQGKGASAGVAVGPILVKPVERQPEIHLDTCLDPQQELKRLQAAQQQGDPDPGRVEGKSPAAGGRRGSRHFLKSIR